MMKQNSTKWFKPLTLLACVAIPLQGFALEPYSVSNVQQYELPVTPKSVPKSTDFSFADPGNFYTSDYPYLFFHNMDGYGIYEYRQDLLDFMTQFDVIWAGNEFPLIPSWVDHLHTANSKRRTLVFYEYFSGIHFVFGKDNPQSYETWKLDFLDSHLFDFWTINPLIPPDYSQFSPGRYSPGLALNDFFINYGVTGGGAESFLVNQYANVKRSSWGYDGVFLDLTGSAFMPVAEIQDPNDPLVYIDALEQYNNLSAQRESPALSYDENGSAFLEDLKSAPGSPDPIKIWTNQAFRSGDESTNANLYYEHANWDLDESTFTTWLNPDGVAEDVSVTVDGVVYENCYPVETLVKPFFDGVATLAPMIAQSDYAQTNYGNGVEGVILNYLRPYYKPIPGGYEAIVDREAIYYGYATGLATGRPSFNWDFFDTFVAIPGTPGAPDTTGLPTQYYYRWAFDPIYFLDLGSKVSDGYVELSGVSGGTAVFSNFDKGFVIINTSSPAQDVTVDLSGLIDDSSSGVEGYYNHYEQIETSESNQIFAVPAAYYPLADKLTNSARVYSYTDGNGNLIGTATSSLDRWSIY